MELEHDWEWRRWQLVHIDHSAGDEVLVDAIELIADDLGEEGGFITLAFSAADEVDEPLVPRLERWAARHDGLCDAFYRQGAAHGCLILFQGADSLVVTTVSTR